MESSVKSAKRVFDVLEFFEEHRKPASALEVAKVLRFPQSSTSSLMRTMTALGYLQYDGSSRTYLPTPRVSLLGHWLSPALFKSGRLLNLMEDLAELTSETILVGIRNGLNAQYIHIIQARLPMRLYVKPGTLRPLTKSGLGLALLAEYPDREVKRIVRRLNELAPPPGGQVEINELLATLNEVRAKGHALSLNLVTPGAGVVAMRLPAIAESAEPMAICVGGLTDKLVEQEKDFARLMRQAIAFHFSE